MQLHYKYPLPTGAFNVLACFHMIYDRVKLLRMCDSVAWSTSIGVAF